MKKKILLALILSFTLITLSGCTADYTLKYENDTYTEIQKDLPRIGSKAKYNGQVYKITSINIITKVCRLENHDGIVNVDYNDIKDHLLPRETPVSGGKNDN